MLILVCRFDLHRLHAKYLLKKTKGPEFIPARVFNYKTS
jgi:hypothetical protein